MSRESPLGGLPYSLIKLPRFKKIEANEKAGDRNTSVDVFTSFVNNFKKDCLYSNTSRPRNNLAISWRNLCGPRLKTLLKESGFNQMQSKGASRENDIAINITDYDRGRCSKSWASRPPYLYEDQLQSRAEHNSTVNGHQISIPLSVGWKVQLE